MKDMKPRHIDRMIAVLVAELSLIIYLYMSIDMNWEPRYWIASIPSKVFMFITIMFWYYLYTLPNGITWPKKSPVIQFVKKAYNFVRNKLLSIKP